MAQLDFRIPATGEAWRHYKGGLYTIIGMGRNEDGQATVIYCDYGWSLAQRPTIYVQSLLRFLREIENEKPRFVFERAAGSDVGCPFINPLKLKERTKSNG